MPFVNNKLNTIPQGKLAVPQVDGQPVGEPQRAYNFEVVLPEIGIQKPIVESIQAPPFETFQIEAEPIGGRHRFVAVSGDAGQLILVLYHDALSKSNVVAGGSPGDQTGGQTAMNYIRQWQRLIQNDDGTMNLPMFYKKSILLNYLNVDLTTSYELWYKGCFPVAVTPLSFAYADSARRSRLQVTFSVDRIKRPLELGVNGTPPNNISSATVPSSIDEVPSDPYSMNRSSLGKAIMILSPQ